MCEDTISCSVCEQHIINKKMTPVHHKERSLEDIAEEGLQFLSMQNKITRLEGVLKNNSSEIRQLPEFIFQLKLICSRLDLNDFDNHCAHYEKEFPLGLGNEAKLILLTLRSQLMDMISKR
jgi:hypothetical protein